MSLVTWSWIFLIAYVAGMVVIGIIGRQKIKQADDFATARRSYGPLILAFAFAATTASGATFLGGPGLAYEWGVASQWSSVLYPMGAYFGVLISMRLIATAGNRFGNRSIPEYLGDRYQSDAIREIVSLFSLLLFVYLAGQLVSGLVIFETMLGLPPLVALVITTAVLLFYVVLGGAHADIMTDSIQGFMMLVLAVVVICLFLFGVGVDGGLSGVLERLKDQNENLVKPLNPDTPLYHSWWSVVARFLAHLPLGLLPHLGNKLWALKSVDQQKSFIKLAFLFGLTMALIGTGGLLSRAVLGEALFAEGSNPNQALPALLIELFPAWLAALIGMGVLAAVMSTADGLVISSSQIVANDLYRRTIVPRMTNPPYGEKLDRQVLLISRVATVVILLICMALAWYMRTVNIAIIVWIGVGGMMASFAGPLVLGALWRGVTRAGAFAGLFAGLFTFVFLHVPLYNPDWFADGPLRPVVQWLYFESGNPFSCTALGEIASVMVTFVVSKLTRPLPKKHIGEMFDNQTM